MLISLEQIALSNAKKQTVVNDLDMHEKQFNYKNIAVQIRVYSSLGKIKQAKTKRTQKHWQKIYSKNHYIRIYLTKP